MVGVDYKLSHYDGDCDDGDGDGEDYDDDHDHLMVGVGPLLYKQIVNGLVAEARRPGKRVLSQVGQALLMLVCLMIIMIIMAS